MPASRRGLNNPDDPDTIRILVATDSHVGYNERDPIRGDDSWKTFHEVMMLAKKHDVDMVLHGGDLFHENKPSRKSMYQVMRSLRMSCFGDKPCQLEMLSDASENFQGAFNHVNYEDPDLNVAIPVFSIHGNHDDPSGEGHYSAMDLLQVSGLVNYYGRTPESDNIRIKPVLLQKGHTKLALFGMSNVRDERLFRTFRDGNVKFFRPRTQQDDWFNLMSVHQNHNAYTATGYLPESFLPDFLDLVVWGHEHECKIEPTKNGVTGFHVMQPGSSVATSLMPGEAVGKHVAILSINTKEDKRFEVTPIKLKTVRPFVMREIVLSEERAVKDVAKKDGNRTAITKHLIGIVESLIKQANKEWLADQDPDEDDEPLETPLPLIRLRVEYTAPDGGHFDCENPQRFSNRFIDRVANVNDVVQFYRNKAKAGRKEKMELDMPEESVVSRLNTDNIKVGKLVREFLSAQTLTILPANTFGDAVSQFVDKDDNRAMEVFVNEALADQMSHLLETDEMDEDEIATAMNEYRAKLEDMFAAGQKKTRTTRKLKPKPDNWDSDLDGDWADQPGAIDRGDEMDDDSNSRASSVQPKTTATRGRGRGRGSRATATTSRATTKKAPAKPTVTSSRGKKRVQEEEEEEEEDDDDDVIMIDDDDSEDDEEESDSETLFTKPAPLKKTTARQKAAASRSTTTTPARSQRAASPAKKKAPAAKPAPRQSKLNFSQSAASLPSQTGRGTSARKKPPTDDEISDDDDAFEPPAPTARSTRRR
ncbi:double-strand break repair protein mus-23 [Diplodia corticola]|uniref:Double-strand break repair protein n=1 Tax=Diplodia corticola TaxID=236234 RepID=A0A1J9SDQ7_9PEZI|nr:double-strand break repair protein mus-23 [Diplodia corticola]OJD37972.1 double-strand break repair protein mus-23 [Diplodia corticola]